MMAVEAFNLKVVVKETNITFRRTQWYPRFIKYKVDILSYGYLGANNDHEYLLSVHKIAYTVAISR